MINEKYLQTLSDLQHSLKLNKLATDMAKNMDAKTLQVLLSENIVLHSLLAEYLGFDFNDMVNSKLKVLLEGIEKKDTINQLNKLLES